ncbi:MAG: GNAT family N-acetyltransferase [Armatimonadota bacterium]
MKDRVDRYWADELGCAPAALYRGGISICTPRHREGPRWMGWMVPFDCLALAQADHATGVISTLPALAPALQQFLASLIAADEPLPPHGRALFRYLREHLPNSYPKVHRVLYCDPNAFAPHPAVFPVETLSPDDPQADWYRLHFDGPVFIARDARGNIASWAAIKCKSDNVWEMAVVTEPPYRGRGLARSVVSRATEAALAAGKAPLYLHETINHASARVCTALGYQVYAHELTCENGRILPQHESTAGFIASIGK